MKPVYNINLFQLSCATSWHNLQLVEGSHQYLLEVEVEEYELAFKLLTISKYKPTYKSEILIG
jgi:hypothetical protein